MMNEDTFSFFLNQAQSQQAQSLTTSRITLNNTIRFWIIFTACYLNALANTGGVFVAISAIFSSHGFGVAAAIVVFISFATMYSSGLKKNKLYKFSSDSSLEKTYRHYLKDISKTCENFQIAWNKKQVHALERKAQFKKFHENVAKKLADVFIKNIVPQDGQSQSDKIRATEHMGFVEKWLNKKDIQRISLFCSKNTEQRELRTNVECKIIETLSSSFTSGPALNQSQTQQVASLLYSLRLEQEVARRCQTAKLSVSQRLLSNFRKILSWVSRDKNKYSMLRTKGLSVEESIRWAKSKLLVNDENLKRCSQHVADKFKMMRFPEPDQYLFLQKDESHASPTALFIRQTAMRSFLSGVDKNLSDFVESIGKHDIIKFAKESESVKDNLRKYISESLGLDFNSNFTLKANRYGLSLEDFEGENLYQSLKNHVVMGIISGKKLKYKLCEILTDNGSKPIKLSGQYRTLVDSILAQAADTIGKYTCYKGSLNAQRLGLLVGALGAMANGLVVMLSGTLAINNFLKLFSIVLPHHSIQLLSIVFFFAGVLASMEFTCKKTKYTVEDQYRVFVDKKMNVHSIRGNEIRKFFSSSLFFGTVTALTSALFCFYHSQNIFSLGPNVISIFTILDFQISISWPVKTLVASFLAVLTFVVADLLYVSLVLSRQRQPKGRQSLKSTVLGFTSAALYATMLQYQSVLLFNMSWSTPWPYFSAMIIYVGVLYTVAESFKVSYDEFWGNNKVANKFLPQTSAETITHQNSIKEKWQDFRNWSQKNKSLVPKSPDSITANIVKPIEYYPQLTLPRSPKNINKKSLWSSLANAPSPGRVDSRSECGSPVRTCSLSLTPEETGRK